MQQPLLLEDKSVALRQLDVQGVLLVLLAKKEPGGAPGEGGVWRKVDEEGVGGGAQLLRPLLHPRQGDRVRVVKVSRKGLARSIVCNPVVEG